MNNNEQDTRKSIIDTTKTLLNEVDDVDKITVRQIAERAGVGVGLINYHFKSKYSLMSIAIGNEMVKSILSFTKTDVYSNLEPVAKLKALVKELYRLAGSNEKLIHFILSREIMDGNMQTPLYLIPLLKEIFGSQKDDMQLRIVALQILHPLQVTGLNPSAFHLYSGIDLSSIAQQNQFIDVLIDNLINKN
jgi:AcrR family transcriptional regulator